MTVYLNFWSHYLVIHSICLMSEYEKYYNTIFNISKKIKLYLCGPAVHIPQVLARVEKYLHFHSHVGFIYSHDCVLVWQNFIACELPLMPLISKNKLTLLCFQFCITSMCVLANCSMKYNTLHAIWLMCFEKENLYCVLLICL